jgi:hypothetical protein
MEIILWLEQFQQDLEDARKTVGQLTLTDQQQDALARFDAAWELVIKCGSNGGLTNQAVAADFITLVLNAYDIAVELRGLATKWRSAQKFGGMDDVDLIECPFNALFDKLAVAFGMDRTESAMFFEMIKGEHPLAEALRGALQDWRTGQ